MLRRQPNYISIADFIAFADAVDAFNDTLPVGQRLNIFYIPLRRNTKIPATSKPMYSIDGDGNEYPRPGLVMDRKAAEEFLQNNLGNIGILAYNDGKNPSLALFDFDIEKNPEDGIGKTVIPKDVIAEFTRGNELPISITRQGGYHVYVVNDGTLNNANIVYQGKHAGELRCHKMYVVAPGSFVPKFSEDDTKKGKVATPEATGVYRLVAARPLKQLSLGDLPPWLELDVTPEGKKPRTRDIIIKPMENVRGGNDIKNDIGITLTEIRARDSVLDEALLRGAVESDRSKADYAIAWRLRSWGFDDSAVAHILRTYRASNKTYRSDYIELTISKVSRDYEFRPYLELVSDIERIRASERKIAEHTKAQITERLDGDPISQNSDGYVSDDGVHHLTDFPTLLPDEKYIHLRGLPRIGKSHWTLTQLAEAESGIYVTSNHDIIEQQFRTFRRLAPEKTAVWIKGKQRCCIHTGSDGKRYACSDCPYRPKSQWDEEASAARPTTEEVELAVAGILRDDGYLCYIEDQTPEAAETDIIRSNIPGWVCPYFALHAAAKEADFVFTVPYYTSTGNELTSIQSRSLMVMDEDTVFKFYVPKTIAIAEHGYLGNVTNFAVRSNISSVTRAFSAVKTAIGEKNRQSPEDKAILTIIGNYEEIEKLVSRVAQNELPVHQAPEVRAWLRTSVVSLLHGQFETLAYGERISTILALEEYQRETGGVSEDSGIVEYAEALLFPHPDNPVYWEHGNPATLYLVADETKIIRTPAPAEKYLIVGFTEGELFAEQMSRKEFGAEWGDHVRKLHIDRFPYGDNFVIFQVAHPKPRSERRLFHRLVRTIDEMENNREWKVPSLALTASKKHQAAFNDRSKSERSIMIQRKHGLSEIREYGGLLGASMIFYSNSRISRGIDVPFIDLLIADACAFAQPHINATIAAYKDRLRAMEFGAPGDPEPIKRALFDAIRTKHSLLTDETTNGVLRISPVVGSFEDQVKTIVVAGQDFRYINPEATSRMHTIVVDEDSDLTLVAKVVLNLPRKVSPQGILSNAGKDDPEYAANWKPSPAGTDQPKRVAAMGCVKTQLTEILGALTTESIISQERLRMRERMDELEGKVLGLFAFPEGKRMKLGSFKKRCYERIPKSYTRAEIDRAIKNLITKKSLIIEVGKEGRGKGAREYQFVRRA